MSFLDSLGKQMYINGCIMLGRGHVFKSAIIPNGNLMSLQ